MRRVSGPLRATSVLWAHMLPSTKESVFFVHLAPFSLLLMVTTIRRAWHAPRGAFRPTHRWGAFYVQLGAIQGRRGPQALVLCVIQGPSAPRWGVPCATLAHIPRLLLHAAAAPPALMVQEAALRHRRRVFNAREATTLQF
jgi:hypothetical protein